MTQSKGLFLHKMLLYKTNLSKKFLNKKIVASLSQTCLGQNVQQDRNISSQPRSALLLTSPKSADYLPQNSILKSSLFQKALKDEFSNYHPEKGKLIYVGTMSNMVRIVKGFSVTTSGIGLALQPYIYQSAVEVALPIYLKFLLGGFVNFFIFITPVLLHLITKRYVTQMYYNDENGTYSASTLTLLVRKKEHSFTAKEVTVPSIAGLFTTLKVNGKPLFVDPSLFLDKEAFMKLMGYDKPIDWSIPPVDSHESKK